MKRFSLIAGAVALALATGPAYALSCGKSSAGFDQFKRDFAKVAKANGVGNRGLKALRDAKYLKKVIAYDQKQARYFKKAGRSGANIDRHYKRSLKNMGGLRNVRSKLKRMNRFLSGVEKRYGVQKEVLVTIWGKETAFGGYTGRIDTINALASLSHDCRRPGLFRPNLIAALKIVDKRWIHRNRMRGAAHGELGQVQFMAANYLRYAKDGNSDGRVDLIGNSRDALTSAANFLRAHGWQPGGSYAPGTTNFRVLNSWNESTAYQHTISRIASQL